MELFLSSMIQVIGSIIYSSIVFLTPIRDGFLMDKEAEMLNAHVARLLRLFIRKKDNAVFNKRLIIFDTHTRTHAQVFQLCNKKPRYER